MAVNDGDKYWCHVCRAYHDHRYHDRNKPKPTLIKGTKAHVASFVWAGLALLAFYYYHDKTLAVGCLIMGQLQYLGDLFKEWGRRGTDESD